MQHTIKQSHLISLAVGIRIYCFLIRDERS